MSNTLLSNIVAPTSIVTLGASQTLTNKTISLGSNTITGTLAQFNTAITDADIAATTHKYHEFTLNAYYYDSYAQERYFRLFTENATYDTARYSPITNVEYWNGTAWVSWTGGDAYIKNLLDGRDDTYADIDHTHKKFRFTINKNSGWPTNALIATYWSWFGNGWTPYTLTIEDTADSVTWTTKETLTFGNTTNTNADYGWHAFYSGNLHNGRTLNRITYDITDWTDAAGYTTKRIYALSIFSNYNGASDSIGVPVSWNYDKVVNFSAVPTVSNVQVATLTASQTLTNKTLTSPVLTTPAIGSAGATFAGSTSGTVSLVASATASGTLTLPSATDTLVGRATADTLSNKTLQSAGVSGSLGFNGSTSGTTQVVATSVAGSTTLTLPAATDTLVGKATTDTLTNKTISNGVLTGTLTAGGTTGTNGQYLKSTGSGLVWATGGGSLISLSDVSLSTPVANQVLTYTGSVWTNAAPNTVVASAVFAPQAVSDLGYVYDSYIASTENLGLITESAASIYDMGQLRLDGIVSLSNIDQSVKADYIGYSIIFGF